MNGADKDAKDTVRGQIIPCLSYDRALVILLEFFIIVDMFPRYESLFIFVWLCVVLDGFICRCMHYGTRSDGDLSGRLRDVRLAFRMSTNSADGRR